MNEHVRKGSKDQLIGLNLWVVCVFLGYVIYILFMESPVGFLMAFVAFLIFITGVFRIFRGLYYLIKGTPSNKGKSLGNIGGTMLAATPLLFLLSIVTPYPANYIVFQVFILMFLSSFIMPYFAHKGKLTGTIAIIGALSFSVIFLGYALSGTTSIPWFFPVISGGLYFVFLEVTIFRTYLTSLSGIGYEDMPEREEKADALGPLRSPSRRPQESQIGRDPVVVTSRDREPVPRAEPMTEPGLEGKRVTSFEDFVKEMGPSRSAIPPTPPRASPRPAPSPVVEKRVEVEPEVIEDVDLEMDDVLMDGEDLYMILRVSRKATLTELRKAYRKRALMYHPDVNRDVSEITRETINEEMRKINKAKEVLFNPVKRSFYDRWLESSIIRD